MTSSKDLIKKPKKPLVVSIFVKNRIRSRYEDDTFRFLRLNHRSFNAHVKRKMELAAKTEMKRGSLSIAYFFETYRDVLLEGKGEHVYTFSNFTLNHNYRPYIARAMRRVWFNLKERIETRKLKSLGRKMTEKEKTRVTAARAKMLASGKWKRIPKHPKLSDFYHVNNMGLIPVEKEDD